MDVPNLHAVHDIRCGLWHKGYPRQQSAPSYDSEALLVLNCCDPGQNLCPSLHTRATARVHVWAERPPATAGIPADIRHGRSQHFTTQRQSLKETRERGGTPSLSFSPSLLLSCFFSFSFAVMSPSMKGMVRYAPLTHDHVTGCSTCRTLTSRALPKRRKKLEKSLLSSWTTLVVGLYPAIMSSTLSFLSAHNRASRGHSLSSLTSFPLSLDTH